MARKRKIRKSLRKNGLRSKTKRHRSYRKRNTRRRNTRRRNTRRRNTRRRNTRRHIGGSDGSTAEEMGMPVSGDFIIYSSDQTTIPEYSGMAGFNQPRLIAYLDSHRGDTYIKIGNPGVVLTQSDVLHHHTSGTSGTYVRIPNSMKSDTVVAGGPSKSTVQVKSGEEVTTPRGRGVPTK